MITITNNTPELNKSITINAGKNRGITSEIFLHEKARNLEKYHLPVESSEKGIDREGKEIKINELGRFLFGVPGYDGHLRIVPDGPNIVIYYPSEPIEAESLMTELKRTIESEL